jgi:hypothetical protein
MSIISKTETVIEFNGKFWGKQYSDGWSTIFDFGPIEKATFVNRRYCKKPSDCLWRGSSDQKKISKGRLLDVVILTTVLLNKA